MLANEATSSPYALWQSQPVATAPFVICAMFTASYLEKAQRLATSLQTLGLPHAIFQVPSIHRSISTRGNSDLTYCKPSFIEWSLNHFQKPVFYVDADCVFCEKPELILALANGNVDFAIYNWFSDLMNDAWVPHTALSGQGQISSAARYWQFSHSCDNFSAEQVMCSGAVQYWGKSDIVFALLDAWRRSIVSHAQAPDDECLDFAFNIASGGRFTGKYFWLPKEYARYVHWPYVRPIVDHPDLPAGSDIKNLLTIGDKRYDAKRLIVAGKARPFPRSCIIDASEKLLLMPNPSGVLQPAARLPFQLYL